MIQKLPTPQLTNVTLVVVEIKSFWLIFYNLFLGDVGQFRGVSEIIYDRNY